MGKTIETQGKEEYIAQEKPAVRMAKRVSETIRKGELVNYGKIAKEVGYSDSTALKPNVITRSIAYQKSINEFLPVAEKARQNAIDAIAKRNMSKERLPSVVDAMDKLTKNIQLLSGKSTDNEAIQVSWGGQE
jgi:hypothetical protein